MAPAKKVAAKQPAAKQPKVTSSSTRLARSKSSKAKVSGATPSSRANRQKVSTAKVSESGKGVTKGSARVTQSLPRLPGSKPAGLLKAGKPSSPGLIGTRNPISQATKRRMAQAAPKPKFSVKEAGPRSLLPNSKFPAKTGAKGAAAATLKSVGSQALKGAAKAGLKAAVRAAPAVLALNAGKVADGTLKGKPRLSADRPKGKANAKEKATAADFGKSFKKARSAGSKVFMFKGTKYTTKRKDGK